MRDSAPLLHIRCLTSWCEREGWLTSRIFGPMEKWPKAGPQRRFVCKCCRGRNTVVRWVSERPRSYSNCGFF